jgi:hypothetical protein
MGFEILKGTYHAARPDLSAAVVAEVIDKAAERANAKHPDWQRFAPAVEFLSTAFFTDHHRMPIDDYIETLYCAVKHGDFSKEWRKELRRPPAVVQPAT